MANTRFTKSNSITTKINNMIERNYKITPIMMSFGETFKVEMINDYGMKRTIYEEDINQACDMVMNWWNDSEIEYKKMKSLQVVLNNKVKKEIKWVKKDNKEYL